jgi:nicotinamide mononucleotide (NMN) deamidase PncC
MLVGPVCAALTAPSRRRLTWQLAALVHRHASPPPQQQNVPTQAHHCATLSSADDLTPFVESIHAFTKASDTRVAVVATGAGSDFIRTLLSVGGASSTVLEAVVPYAVEAQGKYLGYDMHASVHPSSARDFALTALERAVAMCAAQAGGGQRQPQAVGLAVTASLATNRQRRGANRALIAVAVEGGRVKLYEVSLEKERRDRQGEDRAVTWVMLHALSTAIGEVAADIAPAIPLPQGLLDGVGEALTVTDVTPPPDPIAALLSGDGSVRSVTVHPNGRISVDCPFKGAVLAGSFNPLHDGHVGLLQGAAAAAGNLPLAFELALTNADKGRLDAATVAARIRQFHGKHTLLLTAAPTFIEKTQVLPGCAFVVGADTAERLIMEKYYGGTQEGLHAAFETVAVANCRFVVAGRLDEATGKFVNFESVKECEAVGVDAGLFQTLTEAEFRMDISSSALRAKGQRL